MQEQQQQQQQRQRQQISRRKLAVSFREVKNGREAHAGHGIRMRMSQDPTSPFQAFLFRFGLTERVCATEKTRKRDNPGTLKAIMIQWQRFS